MRQGILAALLACRCVCAGSEVSNVVGEALQSAYATAHSNLFVTAGFCRGFTPTSPVRTPGYQHDAARDFILATFTNLGLAASLQPFSFVYSGAYTYTNCNNVIGARFGTDSNAGYYIVGGHYDSVDVNLRQCICPGADDNASGTAAVLEAARVLSGHSFRSTLVFIGFDGEEEGLKGSSYFVADRTTAAVNHDNHQLTNMYRGNIKGMISADMVAFNSASHPNQAWIYGGSNGMSATKSNLAGAVERYGGGLTWVNQGTIGGSDHRPFFESAGVDVALLIDDHKSSPYYHSAEDRLGAPYGGTNYIDHAYATKMVRALVGYLAEQAGLVPTVTVSAPDRYAGEGSSNAAAFRVSRTDVFTNDLRVFYSVGGTASPADDYAALPGSVVLSNGCASVLIPVMAAADDVPENDETVSLSLLPDASYGLNRATNAAVVIGEIRGLVITIR